jgi:hypothetical protein
VGRTTHGKINNDATEMTSRFDGPIISGRSGEAMGHQQKKLMKMLRLIPTF